MWSFLKEQSRDCKNTKKRRTIVSENSVQWAKASATLYVVWGSMFLVAYWYKNPKFQMLIFLLFVPGILNWEKTLSNMEN